MANYYGESLKFVHGKPIPTTSDYVIRKKSKIHRSCLYAKVDIPKGTRILEYVGEIMDRAEGDRRVAIEEELSKKDPTICTYFFLLNKEQWIDGDFEWNTAKHINHSCDENCDIQNDGRHIWIVALRDIKKDEELTYDYGFTYYEGETKSVCRCGSSNCRGVIIDKNIANSHQ